LDIRKISQTRI